MANENFYAALPALTDFEAVLDRRNYHALPADWFLFVTDVRNSTQAIREGRYRAVNMVGAACITAVLNRCRGSAVPYVFSGDGTLLAVPAALADGVMAALKGVAVMAAKQFALELRLGRVPVGELRADGFELAVAKFQLAGAEQLAMFAGNGLAEADRRIKIPGNAYAFLPGDDTPAPDVSGLSCRWEPMASAHGEILTILVQSRLDEGAEGDYYKIFYARLLALTGLTPEKLNPVKIPALHTRWPPSTLALEARTHAGRGGWLARLWAGLGVLAHSFGGLLVFIVGIPTPIIHPLRYKNSTVARSDYRKFDSMLRMVIDVPTDKVEVLLAFLEAEHRRGAIFYGVHRSATALMTCLVFSLLRDSHVHFIDGGDGGYALAAARLKQQMQSPSA